MDSNEKKNEQATNFAENVVEYYNKTKKKASVFLALALISLLLSVSSTISGVVSWINLSKDKDTLKELCFEEEQISNMYEEMIEPLQRQFIDGEITGTQYQKEIAKIRDGFEYSYLKNTVLNSENEELKMQVAELDKKISKSQIAGGVSAGTAGAFMLSTIASGIASKCYKNKLNSATLQNACATDALKNKKEELEK